MQGLVRLPNVHQIQAASISQFTNDHQNEANQCSSQAVMTSTVVHIIATLQCPAGVTSSSLSTSIHIGIQTGMPSWLIEDTPDLPISNSQTTDSISFPRDSFTLISKILTEQILWIYHQHEHTPHNQMPTLELLQLQETNNAPPYIFPHIMYGSSALLCTQQC